MYEDRLQFGSQSQMLTLAHTDKVKKNTWVTETQKTLRPVFHLHSPLLPRTGISIKQEVVVISHKR